MKTSDELDAWANALRVVYHDELDNVKREELAKVRRYIRLYSHWTNT